MTVHRFWSLNYDVTWNPRINLITWNKWYQVIKGFQLSGATLSWYFECEWCIFCQGYNTIHNSHIICQSCRTIPRYVVLHVFILIWSLKESPENPVCPIFIHWCGMYHPEKIARQVTDFGSNITCFIWAVIKLNTYYFAVLQPFSLCFLLALLLSLLAGSLMPAMRGSYKAQLT